MRTAIIDKKPHRLALASMTNEFAPQGKKSGKHRSQDKQSKMRKLKKASHRKTK